MGIAAEVDALRDELARIWAFLECTMPERFSVVCVTCGEEGAMTSNDATDHVPLCDACYTLFKVSGLIPFLPDAVKRAHIEWVEEQTVRLAGRRIGNG